MTPFLQQVAHHYFNSGGVERYCFIFPNRRALSFFRKYLSLEVKGSARPITAPQTFTMNDFFFRVAGCRPADKVHLLLELYNSYKALNRHAETLDEFIFWGDVILSDFDDVDKYLVSPKKIFANVAEFKSIQDSWSYLEPEQREAVNRFLKHFHNDRDELTVDLGSENPNVKEKFLRIWDILYQLYMDFNRSLEGKGYSYEGKAYRSVAERLAGTPVVDVLEPMFRGVEKFVFVGLNALNECEKTLLGRMRDAGIAEFCWDYSSEWIRNSHNKSSFFLADNVSRFPQAFRFDEDGLKIPEFNVVSVPSSIGAAKQIPEIISRLSSDPTFSDIGINTAIVLPDEGMLLPVLNSIPEPITDINVTMGYPMSGSEMWALFEEVASLQMHIRYKDGKAMFYHRQVWAIFSNSVVRAALGPDGLARVDEIKNTARYYITQEELSGHPVLEAIFQPVVRDVSVESRETVLAIENYQTGIISCIAPRVRDLPYMALELDFAKELYTAVNRLKRMTDSPDSMLNILPATYFRLIGSLVSGMTVPFEGEPLRGLQIMGPLETRALDFDNVIILNCNEGLFPRKSVSSSFIPPELRKGFGLPTYEFQDAVWAYYFYRLIQRAGKVWMLFDSRTEISRSGEESRYIKQLELHFHASVNRYVVSAPIEAGSVGDGVGKTEEDVAAIKKRELSASALKNYLSCPMQFYYRYVKGLREDEEITETLDSGKIGNVFHKTMQFLYEGRTYITCGYIRKLLASPDFIRKNVAARIKEELKTFEVVGRNIIYQDLVCQYVTKVLSRDLELMEDVYRTDRFRILGLEMECHAVIGGFPFKGYIDRLDSFSDGEVRVVDYKTGRVEDQDIDITDDNASEVVEDLFAEDNDKRPGIALQLYLYDKFVAPDSRVAGQRIVNSIYQTAQLFVNPVKSVPLSHKFMELMGTRVDRLLEEISDTSVPFRRCEQGRTCENCDFKTLCGR